MTQHPLIAGYMSRFEAALKRSGLKEWADIASDVRSHIAEALEHGKPIAEVLAALGSAEALARSYAAELLLRSADNSAPKTPLGWLKLIALVVAHGITGPIIVVTFGFCGLALLGAGLLNTGVGIAKLFGYATAAKVSFICLTAECAPSPPWQLVLVGPFLAATGLIFWWVLWRYARLVAHSLSAVPVAPRSAA